MRTRSGTRRKWEKAGEEDKENEDEEGKEEEGTGNHSAHEYEGVTLSVTRWSM